MGMFGPVGLLAKGTLPVGMMWREVGGLNSPHLSLPISLCVLPSVRYFPWLNFLYIPLLNFLYFSSLIYIYFFLQFPSADLCLALYYRAYFVCDNFF